MTSKRLPRHLSQAINTVSVTVQQLIFDVALHVSGLPAEPRATDNEQRRIGPNNRSTPSEMSALREYVFGLADELTVEYCAIGIAALSGKSWAEIARFFDWPELSTKGKLQRLRALSRKAMQ